MIHPDQDPPLLLVQEAGDDLQRLKALLRYPDYHVRRAAALQLGRIGRYDCLSALTDALHDPDAAVREAAAQALGQVRELPNIHRRLSIFEEAPDDIIARRALARSLKDREHRVRQAAAHSLKMYGQEVEAVELPGVFPPVLQDGIESGASMYQPYSFPVGNAPHPASRKKLPRLERPEGVPAEVIEAQFDLGRYRQLLDHPQAEVREAVAWALGQLRDPRGSGLLVKALDDVRPEVRRSAARSLGQLEYIALDGRNASIFADRQEDKRVTSPLGRALQDRDSSVRAEAALAISRFGKPELARLLLPLAGDREAGVRAAAIPGLVLGDSPDTFAALSRLLADPLESVRAEAVRAVREAFGKGLLDRLLAALADPGLQAKRDALVLLGSTFKLGVWDAQARERALRVLEMLAQSPAAAELAPDARRVIQRCRGTGG